MSATNNVFTCIIHNLEGTCCLTKIIGASAVFHQNLPLSYRTDIFVAFSYNHFITVDGGSIVVCGPGNRGLGILYLNLHLTE